MLNRIGFRYALQGLQTAWNDQFNFRIHLGVFVAVVAAGFFFGINRYEWLIVMLCSVLVTGFELLNSALEYLTDLSSAEIHPLAKKAKDTAAAAVLLAAVGSVVSGLIIFIPRILFLLREAGCW
jgi:diacylglycerol kinase